MKVLITGALGILGKAVFDAFVAAENGEFVVTALSFSNKSAPFVSLDLQDQPAVQHFFTQEWRGSIGDIVIHCAAERRPDVVERSPETAMKLNAVVPGCLSELSKEMGFGLIYISTDYVFDGTSPPYKPSDTPNPLQHYGDSKLAGERAALSILGAHAVVLRVPVLYGPVPKPSDSAINIILDVVRDRSGKAYKMDHFATRYPTNVIDIGKFLVRLSAIKFEAIPKILHYSAPEPFTKYEIALIFASILKVPHDHIIPDDSDPSARGETTRPNDCKLDTSETEILLDGVPGGVLGCVGFEEWWIEEFSRTK